ncbi:MAG: hypothetical protein Q3966_04920, partial [Neisseria sp.]|nr:hypothetical protein [Neisseria sp.]
LESPDRRPEMKKTLALGMAAIALAACGNNNEAGEKNFKKAINRIGGSQKVCIPFKLDIQMPDGSPAGQNSMAGEPLLLVADSDTEGRRINKKAEKQIKILTENGFYKKEKTESQTLPLPDGGKGITVTAYSLTEKGRKQVLANDALAFPLLCIGTPEVKKINWYTTPAPFRGTIVSKVSYQADLKLERWAEKLIKEGGKEDLQRLKQPEQKIATLVQTDKGWISPRELRPHPHAGRPGPHPGHGHHADFPDGE